MTTKITEEESSIEKERKKESKQISNLKVLEPEVS
jgi:hypothetical protein